MDTRTRASHRNKQHPANKAIKQADLELLKIAQEEGLICLKYLDESGFCLWSPVSYSYVKKGEQKPRKANPLSRQTLEYFGVVGTPQKL
jgi:hypothetical protein